MKKLVSKTGFLAIVACLLWSTAFVGVKFGLQYNTPLQFAGVRFFIAGLMILPFAGGLKKYRSVLLKNYSLMLKIALLNTFFQYMLFYTGLNMTPAALAAIIIGSSPLFVALMAHFMMPDEKTSLLKFAIFVLGFSGIVLVSLGRNRFSSGTEVRVLGIFILLTVNFISGLGNVYVARDAKAIPPFVLSSFSMIFGGGLLFILSLFVEGYYPGNKPVEYYAALAWLSFLSAAAFSIWFTLLKRPGVKVSDLNFWKFLIPLSGAILAWVLIPSEQPNSIAILGMLIIVVSLVALNLYKRRG